MFGLDQNPLGGLTDCGAPTLEFLSRSGVEQENVPFFNKFPGDATLLNQGARLGEPLV